MSFQKLKNIFKMGFPGKGKIPANDYENGTMGQHSHSQSGAQGPPLPKAQVDAYGRPELDPSDNLNLFRHLTGIVSHPSMSNANTLFSSGGRPAPNLGIYARVVHNEQSAKVGFKYFSWLINGCLGLQIVVAATLTALGAAGGSRGAVTVFGAVNTVFAGVLTFLKGSGLPNRFKYYQTEWRRVREFIEQRERDFSRPTCDLDVYGVVAIVESMYEEVKLDLEASQPDRFAGANATRRPANQAEPAPTYKLPSVLMPRMDALAEKGKGIEAGFGSKVKNLASEITHYAQEARDVAKDFQTRKDDFAEGASREVKDYANRTERLEYMFGDKVKDLAAEIGQRAYTTEKVAHDLEDREHKAMDTAVKDVRDHLGQLESAARDKLTGPVTINLSHHSGARSVEQQERKFAEDY